MCVSTHYHVQVYVHAGSFVSFSLALTPSLSVTVVFMCLLVHTGSWRWDTLLTDLSPQPNKTIFLKIFISGEFQKHTRIWVRLENNKHAPLLSISWHLEHPSC